MLYEWFVDNVSMLLQLYKVTLLRFSRLEYTFTCLVLALKGIRQRLCAYTLAMYVCCKCISVAA